jgi:hypothetical protein
VKATVVGGGLAGCEAAWALAERGCSVTLYEMRPSTPTPAHQTEGLAELVCTNSFKSVEVHNAHGLLKAEVRALGSLLMDVAEATRVPAGAALAVDRGEFSAAVTERIRSHPNIEVVEEEIVTLPSPAIIATGPLTSDALAETIARRLGVAHLAFFDAIAPIVSGDSIDHDVVYRLSRYGKGSGDDYLNAPFDEAQYYAFIEALNAGEQYEAHEFDDVAYFEGCLPIEEMRPDETGGPAGSANGQGALCRGTVACGGPRRPDVEPGGFPEPAEDGCAAGCVAHDPRAGRGRGVPVGEHSSEHVPQQPDGLDAAFVGARRPATPVRRPAGRRRGLHGVAGVRGVVRPQPCPDARRRRANLAA